MDLSCTVVENEAEDDYLVTEISNESASALQLGPPIDDNQTGCDLELDVKEDDMQLKYKIIEGDENVEEPKTGMTFGSMEEFFIYYRQYAKKKGFGVVQKGCKTEVNGSVRYVTLACVRQGQRRITSGNITKSNPTTKTGCKAKINAQLSVDGKWFLTTAMIDHNHDLSPGKARLFRCNKNLDSSVKRRLELNDRAGIKLSKNFNSLVVEAGGFENLPFVEKDCQNFIDKARHLRLGKGGAQALCDYFTRMQKLNDGFYYMIDMDDACRLKNVFWADARSRASYDYFGDVITFDTTYMTNRYGMPFAPFVGVNHHGQSIIFGAGLISNEDTDIFVWLFETWLKCMNDRAPNAIITNQNRAIKCAIAKVFPRSRHRFCLWHIMKKLPEKLRSHAQYHAIKSAIYTCVYDSQTCEEFEVYWQSMIESFQLQDNPWLCGLYSERSHWVPIYVQGTFWAGMSTTQRSESMNAFFDDYVHLRTTLKEFVDQFDNALRKKIENETQADFSSFNSMIPCITHYAIEKQFQDVYTNAKFREVQEEFRGKIYCNCVLLKSEGAICTYQVADEVQVNDGFIKEVTFFVYFNEDECEVKCTCGLFEFRGILCRHAITVLTIRKVRLVPPNYILDRWRKDVKRRYTLIKSSGDNLSGNPNAQRCDNMCKIFYELASMTSTNIEHYMEVMKHVDMLKEKYRALCEPNILSHHLPVTSSSCNEAIQSNDILTVQSSKVMNPLVVRSKGRPPSKRNMSRLEKVVKTSRAKKKLQNENNGKQKRRKAQTGQEPHDGVNTREPSLHIVTAQHGYVIPTQDSVNFEGSHE